MTRYSKPFIVSVQTFSCEHTHTQSFQYIFYIKWNYITYSFINWFF